MVDDGSKDKTTDTALEYAVTLGSNKMRVLTLAKNLGKGGAVRRGVRVARYMRETKYPITIMISAAYAVVHDKCSF